MNIELVPYTLRFPHALHTGRGSVSTRTGTQLRAGRALGEVVTWPGFASDNPECVQHELERVSTYDLPNLNGLDAIDAWLDAATTVPEVRSGLELLLLDQLALKKEVAIAALLAKKPASKVPVHFLVNMPENVPACAETIKVKVGPDIDMEVNRISALRRAVGTKPRIRLDANGTWSFANAGAALRRFAKWDIEFVEQPLAPGDLRALAQLRNETTIPIAADESIKNDRALDELLDAGAIDVAILKPAFLGGLLLTQRLAQRAKKAGVSVVITHALGSIVERSGAMQLAAALRVHQACGLGHPYPDENHSGFRIHLGMAHLPTSFGLGIDKRTPP